MKSLRQIKSLLLATLLGSGLLMTEKALAQPGVEMSRQDFYDELSPYGDWMDYPSYGQVWRPRVGADFQPYGTDGHWEMTEYGNTWVSDYDWGWAPFHYGRWLYDNYYGWIWVPDYEWGPAWVCWRNGGGYYGWAPLGPGMRFGIDININIPYNYWVFVPDIYIRSPRVYSYCVPRQRIGGIFGGTTIINNYYRYNNRAYVYGPQRYDLERVTRNRINVYRADDLYRQGRNNGRRYAERHDRWDNSRNNGSNRPNDANRRNDWDNNNNNNRRNDDRRYERNNDERMSRNNRSENNGDAGERRNQQPERTQPQNQGREERPYESGERGGARRTWSDRPQSQGQYPQRQSENRESQQRDRAQERSAENRDMPQQRTWERPQQRQNESREMPQPRNWERSQQRQSESGGNSSRGPRDYAQRSQEQRNAPERQGDGQGGRRRRD